MYYETNEKKISDVNKRSPRGRYFMIVTYLNHEQIYKILNHYSDYIRAALYILHDKDIKEVDDQSGSRRAESNVNQLKEKHTHILLKTFDAHTESAVKKWFYRFRFTDEKFNEQGEKYSELINSLCEMVDSVGASRDYLTHENDPDKYHYSKFDVKEFGLGWEAFNGGSRTTDDALYIIDRINENYSLRQLVREFGRDFVYHYKAYREMASAINHQEYYAQQYEKTAHAAFDRGVTEIIQDDFLPDGKISKEKYMQAVEIVNSFNTMFAMMKGL